MSDKQETLADIVAEFREIVHKSVDGIIAVKADVIADRIEAAWKREEFRWATANGELARMIDLQKVQVGNAAALREAVDYLCEKLAELDATFDPSEVDCLRAALAAPAAERKGESDGK